MEGTHDELVSQFCGITGLPPATAQTVLASANWDLEQAVTVFYASQDAEQPHPLSSPSGAEDDAYPDASDYTEHIPTTLQSQAQASGSASASAPSPAAAPSNKPNKRSKMSNMRTFKDLQNQGDSGSDSDSDHEQDFFAGGEKSGLAVQNPNRAGAPDPFNDILNQARRNAERPADDDNDGPAPPARSSAFTGTARTLGGDDAPSEVIEDPNAPSAGAAARSSLPRIERILHLWQDGFSIDDGPLHRFDDPANATTLALINQGRAPLTLLNVAPGQEVDLKLNTHKGEQYVAPKKKYVPFGGSGQRLGSPTPGPSGGAAAAAPPAQPAGASVAVSSSTAAAAAAAPAPATVEVDESAPAVTLQIRLGDGSRLQARFNTTHTVGDVYDFVNRSNSASTQRAYALMTTFPNKDLSDKAASLADTPELKKGGVVVQKWT